tara:strand:+ start:923 stop:1327 length:405 start_codon:yes stop_codon:yes gene_type:complete
MTINITEVRNVKSINKENTHLDLEINHPQYGWIPYSLSPLDTDTVIDNINLLKLIGKDFKKYVAPKKSSLDKNAADSNRMKRDNLLSATDWRFRSDMKPSKEWKDYCVDLRNITAHSNWPNLKKTDWPISPDNR